MIAAVFILITAIILIIYSMQREHEFKSHNLTTQKAIVNGAAYAINLQLLEKQRHVHLFADEYAKLFVLLNNNPGNEKVENDITTRLQQRFPDFFTFTITDNRGIPKLLNIESLVGHACQLDLNNFAKRLGRNNGDLQNKIFVHPQPFHYHYDVMAPFYTNIHKRGVPQIFFISFYLKEIIDILKTHEIPGQTLMLVKQSDTSLIEVTSKGARDKLKRKLNLSQEEQRRINVYQNIPGTDWRLINLPDTSYEKKYLQGLWMEAFIILFVVTLALFLLIIIIIKFSVRQD